MRHSFVTNDFGDVVVLVHCPYSGPSVVSEHAPSYELCKAYYEGRYTQSASLGDAPSGG